MIVADVMTRNCITIAPEATVEEAVNLMLTRNISGLFVVDKSGDVAGVITEGDLLRRDEIGTERHRPWWLRLLASPARQAADFTRANGRHVRDVMTEDVLSIARDARLEDVVATMEKHRIKRLPVTADGQIVGVVSRADLLRALVGRIRHVEPLSTDDRAHPHRDPERAGSATLGADDNAQRHCGGWRRRSMGHRHHRRGTPRHPRHRREHRRRESRSTTTWSISSPIPAR